MRSQLVFAASSHVPNRYLLCRMLDVWSHEAHRPGPLGSSINEALQALCVEKQLSAMDLSAARGPLVSISSAATSDAMTTGNELFVQGESS